MSAASKPRSQVKLSLVEVQHPMTSINTSYVDVKGEHDGAKIIQADEGYDFLARSPRRGLQVNSGILVEPLLTPPRGNKHSLGKPRTRLASPTASH